MSRILEAWEELQREAMSTDYDEQQHAVFKIALILERHNNPKRISDELYEENLSRELLRLTLDDKRQRDAVNFLAAMVRANDANAESFLYAIGRSKPALYADVLLKLLRERGRKWTPEAGYEAVSALDACLRADLSDMKALLQAYDPSEVLDEWAETHDDDFGAYADRVLERVEALLGVA